MHKEKTDRSFECKICYKKFYVLQSVVRHQKIHSKQKVCCDICEKEFYHIKSLKYHMTSIHDRNPFILKCIHCEKVYEGRGAKAVLKRHMRIHEDNVSFVKYKCNICHNLYLSQSSLNLHKKSVHLGITRKKTLECKVCGKCFTILATLKSHLKKIHLSERLKCDKCSKVFYGKGRLMKHRRSVHNKMFRCDECDKVFKKKTDLKNHKLCVHDNLKKFKSNQCDKSFSIQKYLTKHIFRIHQSITENMFECDLCEKMFFNKDTLNIHKRNVHAEKYSYCKVCNKKFSSTSNMKLHIDAVHLGVKRYQCKLCHESFSHSNVLKSHSKRVHEGTASYKCLICEKVFHLRSDLLLHIKRRHENRQSPNEICPYCNKQFKSGSRFLREHIENIHNKVKNYACDLCDTTFGGQSLLKVHRKTIHNNETFTCNICNKSLRKSFFKRHMAFHEKKVLA